MSEPIQYDFLPYMRRGLAADLLTPDPGSGALPYRGLVSVQLTVQSQQGGNQPPIGPSIQLLGPGDVCGIAPRHIIRTEPRHLTTNYEPNYFAGIEFDHPDFPWLFTPAAPDANHRLRPWISLIVLTADEFQTLVPPPGPLPAITVTHIAALPDLGDSWAWAHAQVAGDARTFFSQELTTAPERALSRLLCPRKVKPHTAYTAFLVPAFDLGVQAGLGQPVAAGPGIQAKPAWSSESKALTLPVYYRFEFHTSEQGDFQSLVRLLRPMTFSSDWGKRLMAVDQESWGIPSAGGPLHLGGALRPFEEKTTSGEPPVDEWTGPDKARFQQKLEELLNKTTSVTNYDPEHPGDDPRVAPPIYGRWHAAIRNLGPEVPAWLMELNLDPRNRSAAGLGTQIVLRDRTQLMAAAWKQVVGIERANQMLRQAQLARSTLRQVYAKHFVPAPSETLLMLTSRVQSRILSGPSTVHAALVQSRLPERALSAAFRRIAAPRRQIRLRQGAVGIAPASILRRLNAGDIALVPPVRAPRGMVSLDDVSRRLDPARVPAAAHLRWHLLTAAELSDVPPRPDFWLTSHAGGGTGGDSPDARDFRRVVPRVFQVLHAAPIDPQPAPPATLAALSDTVVKALDPNVTVVRRIQSFVQVSPHLNWHPADPLEPILAAPEFPQPMYEPLRDLSQAFLLPGIGEVPPNTLGLLTPNLQFIEAYMVGLNHEMARQLLWHDYPTDQRGSYFRQFWDVRSYVPTASDPQDPAELHEKLKDILPLHLWKNELGGHSNRQEIGKDTLILLIRGELLRRYPNTVIYAGRAIGTRRALSEDPHDMKFPLFRGTLPPDVTLLGFPLTREQAIGAEDWFFVFLQPPSEPRFGLEPAPDPYDIPQVDDWNRLSWAHFAIDAATLDALSFAPANREPLGPNGQPLNVPGKVKWGTDAAQMAYITMRRPICVAVSTKKMLHKDESPEPH